MKGPALTQQNKIWDVVLIGGGPAGTSAAITLARSGRSVLLLEKLSSEDFKLGESLPPAAMGLVEHFLGSMDNPHNLKLGLTQTAGNLSAWASEELENSEFYLSSAGFGLCLDRAGFDHSLREKAIEQGVYVIKPAQFKGCERFSNNQANWNIEVLCGSELEHFQAKYLIDCSGRQSVLAKYLGVEKECSDELFAYAQRFVSAQGSDNDTYTRLEASEQGWWYSNRLPSKCLPERVQSERVVVFHTDKNLDVAKQAATTSGFCKLLEKTVHLSALLEKYGYKAVGKIRGAAASSERLKEFVGDAWLAIGDAAQAYDPLSSQGVYKAMDSGNLAGQLIHYALSQYDKNEQHEKNGGASLLDGNNSFLKRYQQTQEKLWQKYITQYQYYYQSQRRWPDQLFWNRRRNNMTAEDYQYQLTRGTL